MSNAAGLNLDNIKMDSTNLYREEVITDLRIGTMQRLIPVTPDGADDPSRPVLYNAQTQIMSQAGPLPIQAPVEAESLQEALEKFPDAVRIAVDKLVEDAREYQRQEASRIVVPGRDDKSGGLIMP